MITAHLERIDGFIIIGRNMLNVIGTNLLWIGWISNIYDGQALSIDVCQVYITSIISNREYGAFDRVTTQYHGIGWITHIHNKQTAWITANVGDFTLQRQRTAAGGFRLDRTYQPGFVRLLDIKDEQASTAGCDVSVEI